MTWDDIIFAQSVYSDRRDQFYVGLNLEAITRQMRINYDIGELKTVSMLELPPNYSRDIVCLHKDITDGLDIQDGARLLWPNDLAYHSANCIRQSECAEFKIISEKGCFYKAEFCYELPKCADSNCKVLMSNNCNKRRCKNYVPVGKECGGAGKCLDYKPDLLEVCNNCVQFGKLPLPAFKALPLPAIEV